MNYTSPDWYKHDAMRWLSGSIRMYSLEHQGLFVNAASIIWRDGGLFKDGIEKLALKSAPIECLREGRQDRVIQMLKALIDGGLIEMDTTGAISIKFITQQLKEIESFRLRQSRNVAQRYAGASAAAASKANSAANDSSDPAAPAFLEAKNRMLLELDKRRAMVSKSDMRIIVISLRQAYGRARLRGQQRDAINMGIEAAICEWRGRNAQ